MYDRFTDRARKVMQLAHQEAQRFGVEYLAPEHVLIGLVKEGSGVAANVLKNLGVDLRSIRTAIEKHLPAADDNPVVMGRLPHTPGTKKVVEWAIEESRELNHNYVGTEHILLGLSRCDVQPLPQILATIGLRTDMIRGAVVELLAGKKAEGTGYRVPTQIAIDGRLYRLVPVDEPLPQFPTMFH
jgi:ATP-dependent Clp protease ATP-binding subunit ClpC